MKAHLSLLEQMKISDAEIHNRLELVALEPHFQAALSDACHLIEDVVDIIVERFYYALLEIDEIEMLIRDVDTLNRLKQYQRKYILDLFSGKYDSDYVNNRLRIGMVHKRIGVEPKLYLSAVYTQKAIIFEMLDKAIGDEALLRTTKQALDRIIYFDITLIFDAYCAGMISEIESARKKTEEYANSLERKVAERTARLEELAKIDPLTGLYNLRAMRDLAKQVMASVKRRNTALSVVYIDVDNFKEINDKYGHIKGDEVLVAIGKIMKDSVRGADMPCRIGGDEFCIILPDTDTVETRVLCNRIALSFAKCYPDFSISLGLAQTGPGEYINEEELISMADHKMYQAKNVAGTHIES